MRYSHLVGSVIVWEVMGDEGILVDLFPVINDTGLIVVVFAKDVGLTVIICMRARNPMTDWSSPTECFRLLSHQVLTSRWKGS
jgi:hypothetical protein